MAWCNAPGVRRALRTSASRRSNPIRSGRIAIGLLALSLGACDFPTEPPIFESRFLVPGEETSLSINELLPSTVTVSGNEFNLSIPAGTLNRSFAQMCPACVPFNGLIIPKPAFNDNFTVDVALPGDVQSAVLAGGSVEVRLTQNFGFDLLRPAGSTSNGSIVITVKSGGATVGTRTINSAFPNGATISELIPMTANATVTSPLAVEIALVSPAGGPITINTATQLNVVAAPTGVRIASASVAVPANNVDVEAVELDLLDLDDIKDRVERGAIVMRMTNPFNVSGTLTLAFSGTNVAKQVTVAACAQATPCTTTQRIEFTKQDLQQLLGRNVTMTISGKLNNGFFTVRPNQAITIDTDLDLTLRIGGDED